MPPPFLAESKSADPASIAGKVRPAAVARCLWLDFDSGRPGRLELSTSKLLFGIIAYLIRVLRMIS